VTCTLSSGTGGQTVRMQAADRPSVARRRSEGKARRRTGGYPVMFCALLASTAAMAGCSRAASDVTTTTRPVPGTVSDPVAPSIDSVAAGRFTQAVEVGDKTLVVSPPPKDASSAITPLRAAALFYADYSFQGIYEFDVLGLGSATLEDGQAQDTSYVRTGSDVAATTTTTRPPPPTTTTTRPPTTTTTAAPPTTTTAPPPTTTTAPPTPPPTTTPATTTPATTAPAPTTTTTAPPPTTTTTSPASHPYKKSLAWVGIAVGEKPACAGGTPSVIAVVIDAYTGEDEVQIQVAGGCDGPGSPVISRPYELESVPWAPIGQASTAITVRIPTCGVYVGWTVLNDAAGATQVQAAVPYDPTCRSTAPDSKIINLVVPLGPSQNAVPHAGIGEINHLDVLP
jgi:hypothetical protein